MRWGRSVSVLSYSFLYFFIYFCYQAVVGVVTASYADKKLFLQGKPSE